MALPRYMGKELTKHLKALAMEAETMSDGGETITKAEALARVMWKKALGYKDMQTRAAGLVEVTHDPEAWAIQLIWERLEGKVANAAADEGGKITAADKISELSRNRINGLSTVSAGNPRLPLASFDRKQPPKLPKKDS